MVPRPDLSWRNTMRVNLMLSVASLFLSGCASAPAPAQEGTGSSDEVFQTLLLSTYNTRPAKLGDDIASEALRRTGLTTDQRAQLLYRRGTLRGADIGDWSMAYPQCATGDYLELLRIAPGHQLEARAKDAIRYQVGREIYFNREPFLDAPDACDAFHEEAKRFLEDTQ